MPETAMLTQVLAALRERLHVLYADDEGAVSTETVIWIALGAALAITLIAIIAAKVTAKANSINLG